MACEGKHERPVHLNRGRHGHVLLCLACGKQLSGPSMELTPAEQRDLVKIIKLLAMSETKTAREGNNERKRKMENTLDITIRVPSNADNSSIAAALRMRAGLFEGMPVKDAASRKNTDAATATPAAAPKAAKGKTAKAAPVQEEAFDLGGEAEEIVDDDPLGIGEGEAEEVTVTLDEVRAAFKAYATSKDPKKGRDNAAKLLAKNFKIKSLTELKPEDFAKALELVGG